MGNYFGLFNSKEKYECDVCNGNKDDKESVFAFCFRDDYSEKEYDQNDVLKMEYYTIPSNVYLTNKEISKYANFFLDYGSYLFLRCDSLAEYYVDNELVDYPQWKLITGKLLPKDTTNNYKQLKKLIKEHPETKYIYGKDIHKILYINTGGALTVSMDVRFTDEVVRDSIRNMLIN